MRAGIVVAALAIVGSARASFDLILVADSGLGVVHRYDGDTGTYLGNFGNGELTGANAIAVDQAQNRAYVSMSGPGTGTGTAAYNYNTGELLAFTTSLGLDGRDLAVSPTGAVLFTRSTVSNTSLQVQTSFGAPFQSYQSGSTNGHTLVGATSDNKFIAVDSVTGQVSRWAPGVTSAPEFSTTNSALVGLSKGDVRGTELAGLTSTGRVVRMPTTTLNVAAAGGALADPFTSAVDFSFGHDVFGWGLGINAQGTRLQRYSRSSLTSGQFFAFGGGRTLNQVQTPVGMAVVLAPEPGTMIALGLGAAALLRRRKKS